MFDRFDDPSVPTPGPGERAAVAARATRLRRRRAAVLGGSAVSVALVVALVAYAAADGPASRSLVAADPPSPSETTYSPEPEPTPTPAPTTSPPAASPSPTPVAPPPTRQPTPTPTPTTPKPPPTNVAGFDSEPDGKPGWSTGFVSCRNATSPLPRGAAPFPGLTLTLELPATTFVAGRSYEARLVIANEGDRHVQFEAHLGSGTRAVDAKGNGSAVSGNDAIMLNDVRLAPGESTTFTVGVVTWGCGDGHEDPNVPLPAGSYSMTDGLTWSNPRSWDPASPSPSPSRATSYEYGDWYVAPQTVRIVESG